MPMPLSRHSSSQESATRRALRWTVGDRDGSRNLIALPTRFWKSWTSSGCSPRTTGRSSCVTTAPDSATDSLRLSSASVERLREVDVADLATDPPDPGEAEQVLDELLHALGAVDREGDVLVGALVHLPAVALLQELA